MRPHKGYLIIKRLLYESLLHEFNTLSLPNFMNRPMAVERSTKMTTRLK